MTSVPTYNFPVNKSASLEDIKGKIRTYEDYSVQSQATLSVAARISSDENVKNAQEAIDFFISERMKLNLDYGTRQAELKRANTDKNKGNMQEYGRFVVDANGRQ